MAISVRIKRSLGAFVYDLFIGRIGTTSLSIRFLLFHLSPRAPLHALTHSLTHSLSIAHYWTVYLLCGLVELVMIKAVIIVNVQGKPRLIKFYTPVSK